MAYLSIDKNLLMWRCRVPVLIQCDKCKFEYSILYRSAEKNRKKNNGIHICYKCLGIKLKPQNRSQYWTKTQREKHSESISSSEKYHQAMSQRDSSGENNGMYGKKLSIQSRKKMSLSRIGKIGTNATAWKGGKTSVNRRVKKIIHERYGWYFRIFERDGWKCCRCSSKKKLDAHHIEPMSVIIKRLCLGKTFLNDDEKVVWLIQQPDIIDVNLKNGLTLCRACHRLSHANWGSHNIK